MWPIACGMLHNSTLKRLLQFGIAIKRGGVSLQDRMGKEKKPYIFVGLVCVREKYQGQGYARNGQYTHMADLQTESQRWAI